MSVHPFAPKVLPHVLKAEHAKLVAALAAVTAPRIYVNPEPDEFKAVGAYIVAVAEQVDKWLLAVGHEVRCNSTAGTDMACFTDIVRDAVEGFAVYECTKAARQVKEDRLS